MRPARIVFLGLLLAAGLQSFYYYPRLPERMASHFGATGQPDGWQSRPAFFGLELAMLGMLAAIFLVLPACLGRIPASMINLPHRDYWLAPERRAASLGRMGAFLTWFGCASLVFLLAVFELVLRANVGGGGRLPPTWLWPLLGGYALFLVGWVLCLVRAFRKPA